MGQAMLKYCFANNVKWRAHKRPMIATSGYLKWLCNYLKMLCKYWSILDICHMLRSGCLWKGHYLTSNTRTCLTKLVWFHHICIASQYPLLCFNAFGIYYIERYSLITHSTPFNVYKAWYTSNRQSTNLYSTLPLGV